MPARAPLLIPGIVLLLADGYRLGHVSLWRDEAYTVDAAGRPLLRILAMTARSDAVNSSYYLVMHGWIAVAGTSAAMLRLPSLLAMAVAAVFTAAAGARVAGAARLPAPALTGVLAGLLFAAAPEVTWYAQDARAYGLVTMFAAAATYLLLRALADGRWRWWAGYGAAILAAGLFNLLSLLILAAHAVTVGTAHARRRPAVSSPGTGRPGARWLLTAGAAAVTLSPLIVTGARQRQQIRWLGRPGLHAVSKLVTLFAGSNALVPLMALLVLAGVVATMAGWPAPDPDVITVALPWLVLPPAILLTASQFSPVYNVRYVIYCLPALALLCAAGLSGVTRLVMSAPMARAGGATAWVPAALIMALLALLVLQPQRTVRLTSSRPDNLRKMAAILAARAHQGDAVLYVPSRQRVFGFAYPMPFQRLRDVAMAVPPASAGNLTGTEVSVATLRARFATVSRVWLISRKGLRFSRPPQGLGGAEISLLERLRQIHHWRVGRDDLLSLYQRVEPGRPPHPPARTRASAGD